MMETAYDLTGISTDQQNSKTRREEQRHFKTKIRHCFCRMQFFNSWCWWDCLCNGSYLGRSGIQLLYGTKDSACGSHRLLLCVPLLHGAFQPLTSDILLWYRYSSAPHALEPSLFASWGAPFRLEGWLS